MDKAIGCFLACIAVGVLTFGHSAANADCEPSQFVSCVEQKAAAGMMSAIFWPLYWSWAAFDGASQ